MSCSRWHRLIALEIGGDLGPRRSRKLGVHLSGCAACRGLAGELRAQREDLLRLDREAVGSVTLGSVRHAVLANLADRRQRFLEVPAGGRRLALAGAVMAALLVVAVVLHQDGAPPQSIVAERKVPPAVPAAATGPIPALNTAESIEPSPEVAPQTPPESVQIESTRLASADLPTARREPLALASASVEPMTVKILTDDPEVVIYWIVDPKGDKENA